jgi:AraC-like DNA-binding protein
MFKEVSDSVKNEANKSTMPNVLSDVLNTIRFRGSIFFRSQLAAPWGFEFEEVPNPRFHIAITGDFFMGSKTIKSDNISVKHMEIVMIPHGNMHWIADNASSPIQPSQNASAACELGAPLFQSGEYTNKIICGIVHYEKDILHPIIDSLPDVLHLKDIKDNDPLWMTVTLIDLEMQGQYESKSSIIDRLTEVLFLQILNKHVKENQESKGFFAALKDPRIHKILGLIHQNSAEPWSLEQLGDAVGMSRSTLSRQFKNTLGMTPLNYVKSWRMMRGHHLIKFTNKSLEQIAEIVGFSTARTFNKAFKTYYGFTPSELRKKISE